jgi:hypothetical protein
MTSIIIKTKLVPFQIEKGSKSKTKIIGEYALSILKKSFYKLRQEERDMLQLRKLQHISF